MKSRSADVKHPPLNFLGSPVAVGQGYVALPSPSWPLPSARTDQCQFRPLVLVILYSLPPSCLELLCPKHLSRLLPNFKKHNQCPMLFVLALDFLLASRPSIAFHQCKLKLCSCSLSLESCSCCPLELYTNLSSQRTPADQGGYHFLPFIVPVPFRFWKRSWSMDFTK